ncbi:MAG: response regulator [Verrucomicrobiota bacterium]|jgi:HD-like signal output (HDOD) protein
MKKQICFAGFAEAEVAALQPALAALGGAWECVFSPDAASALAALAAAHFDAAVANLSQGGINDAELLQQAAVRHPRTLRFVLGNVADRELIVNCMGAAHQFISRPWKPAELVSIIERSLALDAWLSNDKLRSFVPRLGKLPGLPATYFEVLKRAESPHSSVESIAEVIARDPALTARLLQMVNSPACGLTEIITSPAEAVSMLGLETVKSLVLCLQLFAYSAPAQGASLSLDQLWRHSFRVAKLASKIVLRCIASERMASDAYTAGLLHNIGQIVLATNLSREYSAVVEAARNRQCPLQEAELEQLGVTSNQVGAYLLGLWGMPLPLVEATALHHAPASALSIEFSMVTVVHVANVLAHEENGRVNGLPLPKLDADYLATLELPKKTDAWRKLLAAAPPLNESGGETRAARRAPAAAPAQKEGARPAGKLLVVAGIAAILVAGVALRRNVVPVPQPAAPAVAAELSASPGGTEPTKPSTDASPFNSITVQSILYSAGHPVALINGQALDVGERINGVQVISIEPSNVVLACNGEQKTFRLK